jgi:hypothetical protein
LTAGSRVLQAGFLLAAAAAVVVADLLADRLVAAGAVGPVVPFVAVGGRVLGGFSAGMAFRLQQRRALRPDQPFGLWTGIPCALLAAAPMLLAVWPAADDWTPAFTMGLQRLAPFAGAVLGLTFALAVRPGRR